MSVAKLAIALDYSLDKASAAVLEAFKLVRLHAVPVKVSTPSSSNYPRNQEMKALEDFNVFSFSWPITAKVQLSPQEQGTSIEISCSNFGLGPIQSGHCKKKAEQLRDAIMASAERIPLVTAQPPVLGS